MPQRVTLSPSRLVSFLAQSVSSAQVCGGLFGSRPASLALIGVDVEQRRRIVEGHAVDRAVDHRVALQRREELAQELVLGAAVGGDQAVEIGELVLDLHVEQEVRRHDHGGRRLAGLDRGARLDQRVVIGAGVDRGRLDVGVTVVELLDQGAHVAGELAVDGNGEEQIDLGRTFGHRREGEGAASACMARPSMSLRENSIENLLFDA